jgi:hypothetical protein
MMPAVVSFMLTPGSLSNGFSRRVRRTGLFVDLDGGLLTADADDLTDNVLVADFDLVEGRKKPVSEPNK